jgi:hypothetical protein
MDRAVADAMAAPPIEEAQHYTTGLRFRKLSLFQQLQKAL